MASCSREARLRQLGGLGLSRGILARSQRIVTAGDDETAQVWNAGDGQLLIKLEGHQGIIDDVAFSPTASVSLPPVRTLQRECGMR